jgi:2-polyprenyl-3-methyl-5-hydroxy-6-metoxy-1,4-benzoquinol methylase
MQKCLFCSSEEYGNSYLPDTFFNGRTFRYVKCKNCRLIYIDPLPSAADYAAMYPISYQSGINTWLLPVPFKKLPGLRFSYGKQFELIRKFSSGKKILDYGCGQANFLINAKHHGFECDGTEYNPIHIALLKKEIRNSQFYTINEFLSKSTSSYDVIRLSNVLEHLDNPNEIIEKLIEKLNSGGLLLVEGPIETNFSLALLFRQIYFLARKYIQPGRIANHPPTHLIFSNTKNQKIFLKKFNMQELHYEVGESEWPFPENLKEVISLSSLFKYCIARLSIFISIFSFSKWGNTFIYVGKKCGNKQQ